MDESISELDVPGEIMDKLNKLTVEGTDFLVRTEVSEPDTSLINRLNSGGGFRISRIAQNSNFLQVKTKSGSETIDLNQLSPLSTQVTWLDLSGTALSDSSMALISDFGNLTKLHLSQTNIDDGSLQHLSGLEHLEYLNLYGTNITDEGLSHLAALRSLESLFVWQTRVTEFGVDQLKNQLPNLQIDTGWNSGI
jgi:hypothetical protein